METINRIKDGLYYAQQLREKKLSSKELIEESFRIIEKENPLLNAVTHTRKEKALAEAESRNFSNQVYGGVPILLKRIGSIVSRGAQYIWIKVIKKHGRSNYKSLCNDIAKSRICGDWSNECP